MRTSQQVAVRINLGLASRVVLERDLVVNDRVRLALDCLHTVNPVSSQSLLLQSPWHRYSPWSPFSS